MIKLGSDSCHIPGFFLPHDNEVIKAVKSVLKASYWNDIHTRRGHKMSIQITNCGDYGWFSDNKGYYYTATHPLTGQPWPAMPDILKELAIKAADHAGYKNFDPDTCLLNRYAIGTKLSLHQDVDEKDYSHPIVSFSMGVPAEFLWGGFNREDAVQRILLNHGDVVVFGGADRLRFHGVDKVPQNTYPGMGDVRINLTFRKAK